jgi:hypothetical protein
MQLLRAEALRLQDAQPPFPRKLDNSEFTSSACVEVIQRGPSFTTGFRAGYLSRTHTAKGYNFRLGRTSMSLRNLCLFTLAATLAGSTTVGMPNVRIQEYEVPTPNSRPHDPAVAPDGSLWYTGQGANRLGRLDPKTTEFKEYPLKTPNSGPRGLVADKDGNIWFTAISGGYVGKLDPKSGEIAEYRPSDGVKIDPHTPVFDHDGILWFTNEETNYIGRLDPKTGKITLTKVPTAHAVPFHRKAADGLAVVPHFSVVNGLSGPPRSRETTECRSQPQIIR